MLVHVTIGQNGINWDGSCQTRDYGFKSGPQAVHILWVMQFDHHLIQGDFRMR